MTEASTARDPIVGLDVGGHRPLFYCHVSTLTNGSRYFASRFSMESNLQPGDYLGKDEFDRDLYFVDRNGKLFSYILEYLRSAVVAIPSYQQDPQLWKSLRREALFFGVDGLSALLQVTYSCAPSKGVRNGDRGILYFLGTNEGRSETYQNPFMSGKVNITGWVDDADLYEDRDEPISAEVGDFLGPCTYRCYRKGSFAQYRQPVDNSLHLCVVCTGLDVCQGNVGNHIIIDMQNFRVRPSHYSLRGGDCFCLTCNWTFDGSFDGTNWTCLHQGREENYIHEISSDTRETLATRLNIDVDTRDFNQEQLAYLTDQAEELLRGTWAIPDYKANSFYRYFRIRKVNDIGCLHATSFEFFGDVNECPDE